VRSELGKTNYSGTKKKTQVMVITNRKMNCGQHSFKAPDEKSLPIQWTERPTGALVGAGSWWPDSDLRSNVKIQRKKNGRSLLVA